MLASEAPLSALSQWLRLMWDRAPPLHLDSEAPYIAAGEIHLPACQRWQDDCAAAAHAAAHLVYSPGHFDADGLAPIARVLLALLEDARVEALAARELPGLARLWRALHTATPDEGNGLPALLRRLARALADPEYEDPHPWVRKGRGLFYLDARLGALAARTPQQLRSAATRLGHDIGQMRLAFNAQGYRPEPGYRDDHRWMWPAEVLAEAEAPPAGRDHGTPDERAGDAFAPEAAERLERHPEWDRLIGRLRPAWCTVREHAPAPAAGATVATAAQQLGRRLDGPLRALLRSAGARRSARDGEWFDLDALLQWRIARRLRRAAELRPYRVPQRRPGGAAVWLLVDRSASSSERGPQGRTALQDATGAALALALALQRSGVAGAVAAFSSQGRHAVRWDWLLRPGQPVDATLPGRLLGLRSGGSTRLGAVLRHAASRLALQRAPVRWLLLLSDGQPHDIDVHDPRYLTADARLAVQAALRGSVRCACITVGADAQALVAARRIFGPAGALPLAQPADLPELLRRLQG